MPPPFSLGFATGAGNLTHDEIDEIYLSGATHIRHSFAWNSLDTDMNGTIDTTTPLDNVLSYIATKPGLKLIVVAAVANTSPNMNDPVIGAKYAKFVANLAAYLNGNTIVKAIECGNEVDTGPWSQDIPVADGGHLHFRGIDYAAIIIRIFGSSSNGFEHVRTRTDRPVILGSMVRGAPGGHTYNNALGMYRQMHGDSLSLNDVDSDGQAVVTGHPGITVDGHHYADGILGLYDGVTFHTYDEPGLASSSQTQFDGTGLMIHVMEWLYNTFSIVPNIYLTEYGSPTYKSSDGSHDTTALYTAQVNALIDVVNSYSALFAARGWVLKALSWFSFMDKFIGSNPEAKDWHWGIVHFTNTFPIDATLRKPSYDTYKSIQGSVPDTPPLCTVTAPSGTITDVNPNIVLTFSDADGDTMQAYEVRYYSDATHSLAGFTANDPVAYVPVYASGQVTSTLLDIPTTANLPSNGLYWGYGRVKANGAWSAWAHKRFGLNVVPPTDNPPTCTIVSPFGTEIVNSHPNIKITFSDPDNDLMDAYEVRYYNDAVHSASGFTPDDTGTYVPLFASGQVNGSLLDIPTDVVLINNADYWAYGRVKSNGVWGAWANRGWALAIPEEIPPTEPAYYILSDTLDEPY